MLCVSNMGELWEYCMGNILGLLIRFAKLLRDTFQSSKTKTERQRGRSATTEIRHRRCKVALPPAAASRPPTQRQCDSIAWPCYPSESLWFGWMETPLLRASQSLPLRNVCLSVLGRKPNLFFWQAEVVWGFAGVCEEWDGGEVCVCALR